MQTTYNTSVYSYEEDTYPSTYQPISRRSSLYSTPSTSTSPAPSLYGAFPSPSYYASRRASLDSYLASSDESYDEESEEEGTDETEPEGEGEGKQKEETSCSEVLRRQLQTISFTMGIRVFRARRKIRNALHRR